jgi:hypothetical protein
MRNARLDLLILGAILVVAYVRPCWLTSLFNTTLGRAVLIGAITVLATIDTLWAIFAIILLVSFREGLTEGLTSMETDKAISVEETEVEIQPAKTVTVDKTVLSNKDWQKSYCKNNKVMLDGAEVPMSDIAAKFPDLEFLKGECNPCLSNCQFKLTTAGSRVDAEEQLRAKSSNKLPAQKSTTE